MYYRNLESSAKDMFEHNQKQKQMATERAKLRSQRKRK